MHTCILVITEVKHFEVGGSVKLMITGIIIRLIYWESWPMTSIDKTEDRIFRIRINLSNPRGVPVNFG